MNRNIKNWIRLILSLAKEKEDDEERHSEVMETDPVQPHTLTHQDAEFEAEPVLDIPNMLRPILKKAPKTIKRVEYIFPIVGHSFLPSDRVFGRIEKEVRKLAVIIDPEEYCEIFSHHGTVIPLSGINNFDWKKSFEGSVRPPGQWQFQFNPTKKFYFKRSSKGHDVFIKGEVHYRSDSGCYKRFCKKNVKFNNINMPQLIEPTPSCVTALKVRDVDKLLGKHFGANWKTMESLCFYKNIVEGPTNENDDIVDDCLDCGSEEVGLTV